MCLVGIRYFYQSPPPYNSGNIKYKFTVNYSQRNRKRTFEDYDAIGVVYYKVVIVDIYKIIIDFYGPTIFLDDLNSNDIWYYTMTFHMIIRDKNRLISHTNIHIFREGFWLALNIFCNSLNAIGKIPIFPYKCILQLK